MMFLYRQVVAYVPPMERNQFPERFGLPYEEFIRLADPSLERSRFIYPVLNHPGRYRDAVVRKELSELLLWMPPTWERWHEALRVSGGMRWFQAADERFDYRGFWSLQPLRETWRHRLRTTNEARVSREIKQQVRNNYTDLQLVGRADIADGAAELSHSDPRTAYADLIYSSDVISYPSVMGAGGVANVRAEMPRASRASSILRRSIPAELQEFDTEVLESMLEGLNFDEIPASFRLDFLEQWHRSQQADSARQAYVRLLDLVRQRTPSAEDIHQTLKTILRELEDFCRNAEPSPLGAVRAAESKQRVVVRLAAAGSIAATLVGLVVPDLLMVMAGAAGGVFTVVGAKTWFDREHILTRLLKHHAPNIPIELFRDYTSMREFVLEYWRRSPVDTVEIGPPSGSATSNPVRSVWWVDGN